MLTLGLLVLTAMARPAAASAAILQPQALDGPSASILDVDGTAMAPDGSGGIAYRKLVDGVPHVFVSQFANGSWHSPVQADVGQTGPATMPAIAACDGGELVAVWVQPWKGVQSSSGSEPELEYRLMSAVLQPGAGSFSEVEPIDTVGDGTGVDPSITLAPNCSGYVTYRVVTNPLTTGVTQPVGTPSPMDPGDELVDVRVARFDGAWWSDLGVVNAYEDVVTDRAPTTANAPQIATTGSNQAVVVWQEPDLTGYARIWGRYIFGSTLGNAVQLSPSVTYSGQPVDVDADAPSAGFLGEVAFRLAGGAGSPYGQQQVFGGVAPASTSTGSGASTGTTIDLGGGSTLGTPDAGADLSGNDPVGVAIGGQAVVEYHSTQTELGSVLDDGPVLTASDPVGGWTAAWPGTGAGGLPDVQVLERYPDGSTQTGSLSAPLNGAVSDLSVGNSTLGDALIGWLQGPTDEQQVVADVVQPPPEQFQLQFGSSNTLPSLVSGPSGWVRPAGAKVEWAPAVDPLDRVSYDISVDGQLRARGLLGPSSLAPALTLSTSGAAWQIAESRSLSDKLPKAGLGTGAHTVRVWALDQWGQQASIGSVRLRVDATAPRVRVALIDHRHGVRVRVSDDGSGVAAKYTRIGFGDRSGTHKRKDKLAHRYKHAGRYVISVSARDRVGNRRKDRIVVRVR